MGRTAKKILAICGILPLAACATYGDNTSAIQGEDSLQCASAGRFQVEIEKLDLPAANGRSVPFEIIRPDQAGSYPFILFSHGAFASPDRYYEMLKPVAAAGYIIAAPMHIDSEDMTHDEKPSQAAIWDARGEDMVIGLSMPDDITSRLKAAGITADLNRIATMGHSYGALMAQLPAGAITGIPTRVKRDPKVKAVVAYSPPPAISPMIAKEGWSSIAVPSLTITGTADVLPGLASDWRSHKQAFDYAPKGSRTLWVGDGIDHYFGGVFGRQKPADENSKRLFARSIATSIAFLNEHLGLEGNCDLAPPVEGETITKD